MALSDILTALVTLARTVPNIGVVTGFEPYVERDEDIRTYFKDPNQALLLGWTFTREASSERDKDSESNWREHSIIMRGYMALSLTSEATFHGLIESLCTKFRSAQDDALGGVATLVGPPNVRIIQPRLALGQALCHYTEIVIRCTEAVTLT